MMKKIRILLLLVCMIGLAACSSEAGTSSPVETATIGIEDTLEAEHFEFTIISATTSVALKNTLGVSYTAAEGNELIFMVVNAKNISEDTQNVMNTNFNSYVDGEKITIAAAVGEIEGYMPLLGAVSADKEFEGYTVWEVPEGWSKLAFSYIDALTGSESDMFTIDTEDFAH